MTQRQPVRVRRDRSTLNRPEPSLVPMATPSTVMVLLTAAVPSVHSLSPLTSARETGPTGAAHHRHGRAMRLPWELITRPWARIRVNAPIEHYPRPTKSAAGNRNERHRERRLQSGIEGDDIFLDGNSRAGFRCRDPYVAAGHAGSAVPDRLPTAPLPRLSTRVCLRSTGCRWSNGSAVAVVVTTWSQAAARRLLRPGLLSTAYHALTLPAPTVLEARCCVAGHHIPHWFIHSRPISRFGPLLIVENEPIVVT